MRSSDDTFVKQDDLTSNEWEETETQRRTTPTVSTALEL